jgi:Fe-S cluster assembly protein SufD
MTETAAASEKQTYLAAIEQLKNEDAPDWLRAFRDAGAAKFAALNFPTRKDEDWRFTNIAPLVRASFEPVIARPGDVDSASIEPFSIADATWAELVFVDGAFAPQLSRLPEQDGLSVQSLGDAIASGDASLQDHLGKGLNGSANVFGALNSALVRDGAFIHVNKNTAVESPIHLLYISTGSCSAATNLRNVIAVGVHAEATIVEDYVALDGGHPYFNNIVTEAFLAEGAQLRRTKITDESGDAFHLATTRVHQDRSSGFHSQSFDLNGKIVRNQLDIVLDGEGAECNCTGLYLADSDKVVDNLLSVDHAKPNCQSWLGYKGVLDESSRGVFSGQVMVRRDSQKTNSDQLNQNLLLSDKATIDTKPLLEIFADDVKCTHGATIGQHPKEIIFYFRSRGMSEAMARGMLTYGFADERVSEVTLEPVRDRLEKHVFRRYSPIQD